jgi:membrane-associated phospholipid phosphatase
MKKEFERKLTTVVSCFIPNHSKRPAVIAEFLVWTSVWWPLLFLIMVSLAATPNNHTAPPFASLWSRLSNALLVATTFLRAIGISEGCTNLLKHYVARRRPNFYALCQFDTVSRACNATLSLGSTTTARIKEAQYSFPSGHSSLASCSMVFVTWYLTRLLARRPTLLRRGSVVTVDHRRVSFWASSLLSPWLPLLLPGWAVYVGATRLADHWHHFSDVLAGLALGSTIATLVHHTFLGPQVVYDAKPM